MKIPKDIQELLKEKENAVDFASEMIKNYTKKWVSAQKELIEIQEYIKKNITE